MPIDPTWIKAGSEVLGRALQSNTGPSRADAGGGVFDFGGDFIVNSPGAGSSALMQTLLLAGVIAGGGYLVWVLWKKS